MKMKTTLLMCLLVVSGVNGNIAGSNPSNGACLCISGNGVNIRGSACGGVIGSESRGKCVRYSGSKNTCSLGGTNYEFFQFDYGGGAGWAAGNYLDLADNSQCGSNGGCLCFTGNGVNIRGSPCGGVLGSANSGQCYKSTGSRSTCSLNGQSYEFLQFSYGGGNGWSAGNYLSASPMSRCGSDAGCLCFTGNGVNIRDSPCGEVLGSANSGKCYKSTGSRSTCSLNGQSYEFLQFNYEGKHGWAAGNYLSASPMSRCETPTPPDDGGTTAWNEYSCELRAQGGRIHETTSRTPYDCVDYSCRNTCKGGQCVAYVTCSCKRNGKWAPNTSCWRPGRRVKGSDGKCNRSIKSRTAIATFTSGGRYYAGHACVFIRCVDDYTVEVYDQGCSRSIGYSRYGSSHRYFSDFSTITSPGCGDRGSWPCRVESAGPTSCPISVKGC